MKKTYLFLSLFNNKLWLCIRSYMRNIWHQIHSTDVWVWASFLVSQHQICLCFKGFLLLSKVTFLLTDFESLQDGTTNSVPMFSIWVHIRSFSLRCNNVVSSSACGLTSNFMFRPRDSLNTFKSAAELAVILHHFFSERWLRVTIQ